MPAVAPQKGVTQYEFQQSKYYPETMRTPFRCELVSGSGGGKTTAILSMCLQIYGFDVFQRIIVVSPSLGVDDAWTPLFAEMRKRGIDPKESRWTTTTARGPCSTSTNNGPSSSTRRSTR